MTEFTGIPMEHGLALSGVLFSLGLMGLLVRRQFAGHAHVARDRNDVGEAGISAVNSLLFGGREAMRA